MPEFSDSDQNLMALCFYNIEMSLRFFNLEINSDLDSKPVA